LDACLVRAVPLAAGPPGRKTRDHPATSWFPFSVLSPPVSAVRPVGRSRPPWSLAPYNGIHGAAPLIDGVACSRRGPLSGFLNPSAVFATPSSTALFRAAAVPELRPSERSPHEDRGPLSRPPAPLRSSTRSSVDAPPGPYRPRFHRLPRPRRGCLDPPQTMDSLSTAPEDTTSRSPWVTCDGAASVRQLHPLRSLPPFVSPFAPLRVAPQRRPLLSWASAPPAIIPSKPWSLRPARARGPEHAPPPGGESVATQGTSSPPNRVRPNRTPKRTGQPRRQSPAHFWTGPRRLSTASPSPLTFGPRRANPSKLGLRSF